MNSWLLALTVLLAGIIFVIVAKFIIKWAVWFSLPLDIRQDLREYRKHNKER